MYMGEGNKDRAPMYTGEEKKDKRENVTSGKQQIMTYVNNKEKGKKRNAMGN